MKFFINNEKEESVKLYLNKVCGDVYLMAEKDGKSNSILKINGSEGRIEIANCPGNFLSKIGFDCVEIHVDNENYEHVKFRNHLTT